MRIKVYLHSICLIQGDTIFMDIKMHFETYNSSKLLNLAKSKGMLPLMFLLDNLLHKYSNLFRDFISINIERIHHKVLAFDFLVVKLHKASSQT